MPETLGVLFVEGERIVEVIPEGSRPITAKLRAHVQERLANRQLLLAKENTYDGMHSVTVISHEDVNGRCLLCLLQGQGKTSTAVTILQNELPSLLDRIPSGAGTPAQTIEDLIRASKAWSEFEEEALEEKRHALLNNSKSKQQIEDALVLLQSWDNELRSRSAYDEDIDRSIDTRKSRDCRCSIL